MFTSCPLLIADTLFPAGLDTAIHSPPMKRLKKTAVVYGADLLAFELNGEVVSGLPGHHSLENLVLSWATRVVGDDCLEIHVLLMFF